MSSLDTEPHQRTLDNTSTEVVLADDVSFDVSTDMLVAGGGCGLVATLADSVDVLTEELGCDPAATRAAVESYNDAVEAGDPDEVGRTEGRPPSRPRSTGRR
jgi:hypothetical protein